eukprot:symbB.v1.2.008359.t1/scaffold524.1/size192337/8
MLSRHVFRRGSLCRWKSTQAVTLRWADGTAAGAFLPKYLRENTLEAWDNSSKQRLDFGIPSDLKVKEASLVNGIKSFDYSGPLFRLEFSDGHVGHFPPSPPASSFWSKELQQQKKCFWGTAESSKIQEEMTSGSLRFEFSDLLDEKKRSETARRWIEAMHIHGVAVVSGMPISESPLKDFASALGTYISPSVYGETFQINYLLAFNSSFAWSRRRRVASPWQWMASALQNPCISKTPRHSNCFANIACSSRTSLPNGSCQLSILPLNFVGMASCQRICIA